MGEKTVPLDWRERMMTICMKCKNHHVVYWGTTGSTDCCLAHPTEPKIDLITGKDTRMFYNFYEECGKINNGNCTDYIEKEPEIITEKKSWLKRFKTKICGEIK